MRKFSPEEQFQQSNRIMVEAATEEGAARKCLRFVSLSFFSPFLFFSLYFFFSCPFYTLNGP